MKIDLFRYRLPLTAPIELRKVTLSERTGLLIRVAQDGLEGWGEAAPLIGFSRETEEEALVVLKTIRDSGDADEPAMIDMPSSVRFAVECALLDLHAQREGKTMAEALHPHPAPQLALNALVMSQGEYAITEARQRAEEGYRTLKLKVGRRSVEEDIETIMGVQKACSANVKLRLDANKAWSFEKALRIAEAIDLLAIEYIEEPLAQATRLGELVEITGMPVALDESLVGMEPGDLVGHSYARAVVLKPSLGGGLWWAVGMAKAARELGIVPVISNAFESGVGLRAHVALAAAVAPAACGLKTYQRFAEDVYSERLPLNTPLVDVAEILAPRTPDLNRLEQIS